MNKLTVFLSTLALSVAGMASAATDNAPDILIPSYTDAGVIHGLSNNGKYGVASINPGSVGFSYTVGAVFYDLTGSTPVATNIGTGHSASGANDVTDDGKLVVGAIDQVPAVCRYADGKWTWEKLPLPDKTIEVAIEDMYTGEQYMKSYKLNGGYVNSVSADGKYAVGVVSSQEFELIEQAIMWDLETMKIIEVNSPATNSFGEDDHQTRYMQVSNDGRYLLCWNSFSYAGSIIFVYDRQKEETIYIDVEKKGNDFVPRVDGFRGLDLDGFSKSLTSDGHYVAGGIQRNGESYAFRFDVWNKELKIYQDGIHDDVNGWSVTKDGLTLAATPAVTPYADALVCTDDFLYPFESLFREAYGMNIATYGIDNTGKPTLVSDDGRTVVFVTEQTKTYLARFKEDLKDGVDRINLMSKWSVVPVANTRMTQMQTVTFTFDNPVEVDASKYSEVKLLDSNGNVVGTPLENGGLQASGMKLSVNFKPVMLEKDKTYTLSLPKGICWLKGHPNSVNNAIEVKYVGRGNAPVAVRSITPASGSSLSSLDLNDNPVVVTFDAPVMINGTAQDRPIARLYIDGSNEAAAALAMDVDLYTNSLVIYPNTTFYLYQGSEYKIEVPVGVVTDVSGMGPSEAFAINYTGTYVPQMGDELYVFRSNCDDFSNFLFYEGDKGTPTAEYQEMGFTAESTPWWVVMDDEYSIDMAFASHSCYTDGRQANDWFAIRQLNLPSNVPSYLTFQSQSYRKNKNDYLKVYVYVNDASINQLTSSTIEDILKNGDLVYNEKQSPGATEGTMAGEWTDNTISLEKYQGKNVYICFLNDNQNQSMVMVDNIQVKKEVKSFITITGATSVVDQTSATVKGMVTIENELGSYSALSMTLLDSEGNEVSSLSASGLSLTKGDIYNFEFPQRLPVTVGEENPFSIKYFLDEDGAIFEGMIRDLAFQPVKRVIVEEYTGRDCQFCPLGIAAMERLESLYGDKIIPIVLHAYSGTDPKGAGIMGYASTVFMGSTAAPNGRINRRPNLVAPMYSDSNGKYHFTAADVEGAENVWQDEVVAEFNEPTYLDIELKPQFGDGRVRYEAVVKSALNLKGQNIRVLGMLMEDELYDFQKNGLFNISDPLLGEFGQGGQYGQSTFLYYFNNVARGYWGQSANGTPRLIPSELEVGKEYSVDILYTIPSIVQKPENLKMAVVLIDESTGRVINAAVMKADITGVDEITDDFSDINISKFGNSINVESAGEVDVTVYTLDGRVLKAARTNGSVSLDIEGYNGVVIVRAVSGGQAVTKKFVM